MRLLKYYIVKREKKIKNVSSGFTVDYNYVGNNLHAIICANI